MSVPARRYITPEEYLEIERAAELRSEYHDGEMFAMAGASEPHAALVTNITASLAGQLRGQGCRVYANDLRVRVSATGLYTYPDVLVVCGERQLLDGRRDTLLNPTLIVEVLSPSTQEYDRTTKFTHYQTLDSLQEYVLVWQDRRRVEVFRREENGSRWSYTETTDPAGVVRLEPIQCTLPMAEVYEDVDLAEPLQSLRDRF